MEPKKKWALTLEAANICDLTNPHFQKWNLSSKQKWWAGQQKCGFNKQHWDHFVQGLCFTFAYLRRLESQLMETVKQQVIGWREALWSLCTPIHNPTILHGRGEKICLGPSNSWVLTPWTPVSKFCKSIGTRQASFGFPSCGELGFPTSQG